MKRIIFFILVLNAISCTDDLVLNQEDPVLRAQRQIEESMLLMGYSKNESNSNVHLGNSDATAIIASILIENGFKIDENPQQYNFLFDQSPNSRTMGCTHSYFHLSGNGILGKGTSVVVWECTGYISNEWWVDGKVVGENRYYL